MSQHPLAMRVDRAMMAEIFGEDVLDTVSQEVAERIGHQPTRVFLTTVGLPDQEDVQGWFSRVEDLTEEFEACRPDEWVCLGEIPYDGINLDVSTGAVHVTPDGGGDPYLLNNSLQNFAYLLCLTEAARTFYGARWEDLEEPEWREKVESRLARLYGRPYEQVGPESAARLRAAIEEVDPVALARPESTWHMVLRYVAEGVG